MSRVDISDPEIQKTIDELKKPNASINWLLLGYVPKSDTKLKVVETGNGGLAEMSENLNDGKVLFSLVVFDINKTKKFAYISWCGEGVTGMKKGLFNNHSQDVSFLFKGYHVQINARNENDVVEKDLIARLTKASGASYDSGQKNQGATTKLVPTSVAQGRQQSTQSNAKDKVADKSDYNKKNESEQFWTTQKTEEDASKAPKPVQRNQADYNKSNERNQFWAQQNQNTASSAPQKQTSNVNSGNSSSLKSRFENMNVKEEPKPRPPVNTGAPRKQANAPPPTSSNNAPKHTAPQPPRQKTPEPEPEPEQQQEEWQQEQEPETPQHDAPPVPEENQQQEQEWQQEEQQQEEQQYQQEEQQYQQEEQYQEEQQQDWQQEEQQEQNYDDSNQGGQTFGGNVVRALYDFQAENETDLNFKEGDLITVLDRSDPSGWYEGELNGARGYFPSNFVEENQ